LQRKKRSVPHCHRRRLRPRSLHPYWWHRHGRTHKHSRAAIKRALRPPDLTAVSVGDSLLDAIDLRADMSIADDSIR
jgi:hypothetical protein